MADTRNVDWPPKPSDTSDDSAAHARRREGHELSDASGSVEVPEGRVDPRIGQVLLERYRIGRKLGQGGMGTVFEGTHLLIDRRVAIKCLHPQYNDDEDVLQRFHNEARAVSAIGHPHIVQALDRGRMNDGTAFIVFEYLEGQDLASLIEHGEALPEAQVLPIARQVCEALAAAHDKGIVHRDLKPENIFLVEREGAPHFVKLLDFGISKLDFASKISSKGNVMGTPHYMSPEQANGFELDGRTDLYALGVVLYVMLSGQLPFGADSMPALMMKIVAERPAELTRVNTHVSAALSAIVDRLLAKRPEDRYQSAAETLEALDAAVHSPEMAPKEAVLTAVSSTRPSRPIMLALAFTALAAAGWVLWPTAGDDAAVESPPQRSQATQTRSAEATDPRDASAEATDTNARERSGAPSESEGAPFAESPTAGAQANAAAERRAPRRVVWMRPDPAEAAAETNVESSEPDGPNETPEPSPPEPSPPEPASPPAGLKTISI